MNMFKKGISHVRRAFANMATVGQRFDEVRINQGLILSRLNRSLVSKDLKDYEFKVFSQWGEDGIIQHLINTVEIRHKTFIEFGVEDFFESNCRFLLMKDDWRGFVIDGSPENIGRLKASYFYWKHQLDAVAEFITKDNINSLLARSGFDQDLGLLSVDIDGNDYHVLEAINFFKPRILVCEFNPVFGNARKISVPYDAAFRRSAAHFSNLYWGASLPAMVHLANKKGYSLVGTNSAGNNAFFVRDDLVNDKLQVMTAAEAFSVSRFRECRNQEGRLTYTPVDQCLAVVSGLPVLEVETGAVERL